MAIYDGLFRFFDQRLIVFLGYKPYRNKIDGLDRLFGDRLSGAVSPCHRFLT